MPSELMLPPALFLIVGAFLLPLLPERLRAMTFLMFPALALAVVVALPEGFRLAVPFLTYELTLCDVSPLTRIFGVIFSLIALIGGIYSYHHREVAHQSAALLYAGGALGVTFAGDYFTLFVFWELMAIASTYLVWARRTPEASAAGMRYLLVHLFGGGLLMLGILLHTHATGTTALTTFLPEKANLATWLILAGVALNTAIPPLHAWLADAYPKATVTGAVFLSAFTTKSAVLILIKLFAGWEILIWLGVIMALYGVVYAVLANDIRGILAYHIISQVGYMVAAVGIGTEMALNGATAHAFSHILYKSLLFMGAGVVLHTTGKSKLTELGGLAKAMPVTLWLYMIGAFSISGFPLFNGFISKSMVVAAANESHLDAVALLLLLASVGTFLHTGLKLPYFTWWSKEDSPIKPTATPINMHLGMAASAFFCVLFGVYPELLYNALPFPVHYQPYTLYHLTESVQILSFTFIAFWILRKKLAGDPLLPLDTDWVYRRLLPPLGNGIVQGTAYLFASCETGCLKFAQSILKIARNPLQTFSHTVQDYDPDTARVPLQIPIMAVIASFVVIGFLVLVFAAN